MAMIAGPIKTALVDIDRSTEFAGDDVDHFSELVDLEQNFQRVLVWIPVLDAEGIVSIYVQRDGEEDSIPLQVQAWDTDATGHYAHATSSGAGSIAAVFDVGGVQYIRMHVAGNQAADITFYVRGC